MRHSKFTAERLSCSSVFIVLPLKFLEFVYVSGSSKFFTAQVSGVCLCFWFFKVFHCCYSAVCTLSAPVSFFPFPASESWLVSPCSGQDQGPGRPWVRLRLLASQSQPGSSASGSDDRALHVLCTWAFCISAFCVSSEYATLSQCSHCRVVRPCRHCPVKVLVHARVGSLSFRPWLSCSSAQTGRPLRMDSPSQVESRRMSNASSFDK